MWMMSLLMSLIVLIFGERVPAGDIQTDVRQRAEVDPLTVSAATWSDGPWPLKVDSVRFGCFRRGEFNMLYIEAEGKRWQILGVAGMAPLYGAEPSINPIQLPDPNCPDAEYVSPSALIKHGKLVANCEP